MLTEKTRVGMRLEHAVPRKTSCKQGESVFGTFPIGESYNLRFILQKAILSTLFFAFLFNLSSLFSFSLFADDFQKCSEQFKIQAKSLSTYRTDELSDRVGRSDKWLSSLAHYEAFERRGTIQESSEQRESLERYGQGVNVLSRSQDGRAIVADIVVAAKAGMDLYFIGHRSWDNIDQKPQFEIKMEEYHNLNYPSDSSYYRVRISSEEGLHGLTYMFRIGRDGNNIVLDPNANYFTPYSTSKKREVRSVFWDTEYMSRGSAFSQIDSKKILSSPIISTEVSMLGLVKDYPGFEEHKKQGKSIFSFAKKKEFIKELKDRGINVLHILPITQSDDATMLKDNDPVDALAGWSFCYLVHGQRAINSAYGTPDEFRSFVSSLAEEGIAVMMDMVFHFPTKINANERHIGDRHIGKLGIYSGQSTKWGTTYYDFTNPYVTEYLTRTALGWVKDFGIKFIRLDAGDEFLQEQGAEEFLKKFTRVLHDQGVFVLIERFYGDEKIVSSESNGGLGVDIRYSPRFWSWVNNSLTQVTEDVDLLWLQQILNSQPRELYQAYFTTSHDKAAPDHDEVGSAVGNFFPTVLKQASGYHVRGKIIAYESLGMSIGAYYISMLQNRFLQPGSFFGEGVINWRSRDTREIDAFLSDYAKYIQSPQNREAFSFSTLHPYIEHFIDNTDKIIGLYRSNFRSGTEFKDYYIIINMGDRLVYTNPQDGYKIGVHFPGKYRMAITSDASRYHGSSLLENQLESKIIETRQEEVFGNNYSLSLPFIPPYSVTVLERVSD